MTQDEIDELLAKNPKGTLRLLWDMGLTATARHHARCLGICLYCALAPLSAGQQCEECKDWGEVEAV